MPISSLNGLIICAPALATLRPGHQITRNYGKGEEALVVVIHLADDARLFRPSEKATMSGATPRGYPPRYYTPRYRNNGSGPTVYPSWKGESGFQF